VQTATRDEYLTVREVADRYRVDPDTVQRWIRDGVAVRGLPYPVRLAGVMVGNRWRVPADALAAFLAACNPGREAAPAPSPATDAAARAARKRLRRELGRED
jgi:hypothetical protein